jgi:hypothetical protein
MKLQAFRPSNSISLQSQTSLRSENRLPLNGLDSSSRTTAYGETIEAQLTGTEMNHIVHGNRDRREQRTPKMLLPNPR